MNRILAIETSCDDTSVAVVSGLGRVEACCSAHQDLAHAPFGGVVPEIASRNHTEAILPLVETALQKADRTWTEIEGVAVTNRPGLLGSLLVGVVTAKTLALTKSLPWIAVNHIEGHLLAPWLRDDDYAPPEGFAFPYLALAISGGHTHLFLVEELGRYRLLGKTVDDAAGEAFDKFAKMMGLGYPGGVHVDRQAKSGRVDRFQFPRSMLREAHLDFSFSGLKTAGQRALEGLSEEQLSEAIPDLCASFQEAIVDVLLAKLEKAGQQFGVKRVVLTGGVSANSRLRERAQSLANARGWQLAVPPLRYCTDNAAMIGYAGLLRLRRGEYSAQDLGPSPSSLPTDFL
ncbi:MAG: tRNA (adenosine(37)-N6)-threonylcarbamoyltransferase complex transferase subunit TsaD [Bdellovibrionales bacterium]